MTHRFSGDRAAWLFTALAAALVCAVRMRFAPPYAASWDAVDFALALDRFDLLAMQPHFPGYPYFVLAAMLVRPWAGDPVLALSWVSALAYASAAAPMFALARASLPVWWAAGAALLMQTGGYLWLTASQPMSEGMAVGVLWWYFWSLHAAFRSTSYVMRLLPALVFGLLMGVRLSYAVFGAGLLLLAWRELRDGGSRRPLRTAGIAAAAAAAQLLWLAALVSTEGGFSGFIELARAFVVGHFTEWGGAATADASAPFFQRFVRLVFYNVLWVGLCGGSVWAAAAWALAAAAAALGLSRSFRSSGGSLSAARPSARFGWLAALCGLYLLWALFAQNVDKPRHIAPLLGPLLWLAAAVLYRAAARKRRIAAAALAALLAAQTAAGAALLATQHRETPAVMQLHEFLAAREGEFAVYTWEEARVLEFAGARYPYKRIWTYELLAEEARIRPDREVLLTDAVLEGFAAQEVEIEGKLAPIRSFSSNSIIEPVYNDIVLYRWELYSNASP